MEPVSLFDLEAWAKQQMPHDLWDFVAGGCNDEITVRRNHSAFEELTINPRFLVDVSNRDLSTTVLGEKISFPVMIAPAGGQRQVHPEGERATARAAGSMGTLYALPTSSGYSIEEVAEVATGPLWFQLYHYNDQVTELFVTRAKKAGYKAIVLTIDTPSPSPKEKDVRNRFMRRPGVHWGSLRDYPDMPRRAEARGDGSAPLTTGLAESIGVPDSPDWNPPGYVGLTWERLGWLRGLTGLPLVVKGVRTVEDAVLSAQHGADAIVVSNHGGRQLDGTLSTIETLPAIADAVGDRLEVYLDSGVRRGVDVLKAIALGARAVFVGRPLFWGLAVNGEAGVRKMLMILREEFDRAMSYCGKTSVAQIDRSVVNLPCQCWTATRFAQNGHVPAAERSRV
ncbi:MAG: alpha-hydroxy-acid oxidizing protein [Chloroflexi bacterium]|nr:alpha-hydroxy-acid oxidizing protein [Chloroflexota bacterium]